MQSVLKNHSLLWWEDRPADATSSPFKYPILMVLLLDCTPASNIQVEAGILIVRNRG